MKYTQKMLLVMLLVGSSLQGSELLKLASSYLTNCWAALQKERVARKKFLEREKRIHTLVAKLHLNRITYPNNINYFSKDLVPVWCAERLTPEERDFLEQETYLRFASPPRIIVKITSERGKPSIDTPADRGDTKTE